LNYTEGKGHPKAGQTFLSDLYQEQAGREENMVIDFHVHIFSQSVREDRAKYFPDEPAFRMLYDYPKSRIVGAEDTVRMMDQEGVDKSVVFGFPWKNPEIFKRENDYILDAAARYPDRLIGFCCFDAMNPAAASEAERCLEAGLSGVGELAFYESGIDEAVQEALDPVMAVCREKDAPILIHTNEPVGHLYPGKSPNTLAQIYALIKRYGANKIVLAHWGGGIFFYRLLKKEVKETLQNVWYDTAASPFLYGMEIYQTARHLGCLDRVLFGTDYPLIRPVRYFREIENAMLSKEEAARVMGLNARDLLMDNNSRGKG
jgi:hypothetical protein